MDFIHKTTVYHTLSPYAYARLFLFILETCITLCKGIRRPAPCFVGANAAPTPPRKRGALHPNSFKKASQEKGRLRRSTASVFSASSAKSCKGRASRTLWHFVPRDATFAPCRGYRRPCTPRKRRALYPNWENEKGASQDCATRGKLHASQKHEQASTGPQAIAPWCGRASRVDCGKLRSTLLAVLWRSRLPIFSSIFFSPIWGFSLNLSFFCRSFLRRIPSF